MKYFFLIVSLIVTISGAIALYFNFVYLGQMPWNNKKYSRTEILEYANSHGLRADLNAFLIDSRDRISEENKPGDSSIGLPLYRVFNKQGVILRQHCCFESVPGFIDSVQSNPRWYTLDSTLRLQQYLRNVRLIETSAELKQSDLGDFEYVVLYYWDNTLEYNMTKARDLVEHLHFSKGHIRLILVNTNDIMA